VPGEDQIATCYEIAVERLERAGLERYEISNFARRGFASAHNLKYWRREPYLGFGAGAHSFDGAWRWQNVESAAEYVERSEAAGSVVAERTRADSASERLFLGLRLAEGVPRDWAEGAGAERFLEQGLLERHEDRLRLTPRGILLSNELFAEFV
jgi:oxygen-independent coproporphyrinogen-3 oxidase